MPGPIGRSVLDAGKSRSPNGDDRNKSRSAFQNLGPTIRSRQAKSRPLAGYSRILFNAQIGGTKGGIVPFGRDRGALHTRAFSGMLGLLGLRSEPKPAEANQNAEGWIIPGDPSRHPTREGSPGSLADRKKKKKGNMVDPAVVRISIPREVPGVSFPQPTPDIENAAVRGRPPRFVRFGRGTPALGSASAEGSPPETEEAICPAYGAGATIAHVSRVPR